MSGYRRFAVYYLPEDPALAGFGASWLGWDVVTGTPVAQPDLVGGRLAEITETPRKYGLHGTLKAPFRLADGRSAAELDTALRALAEGTAPVAVDALRLRPLDGFLALQPEGDASALGVLAFACVTELDRFRAPSGEGELDRRRAAGLTPRQEDLLLAWGYPYVAEAFRFHITLTGRLEPEMLEAARIEAERALPKLPRPFTFASVSLVGERDDGRFELVHRYALSG